MRQNALHYAAKCSALCGKMQVRFAAKYKSVLRQNTDTFAAFCFFCKVKQLLYHLQIIARLAMWILLESQASSVSTR
jgi:hypothetical protein